MSWRSLAAASPWPPAPPEVSADLQGWFEPENATALGRALAHVPAPLVLELGTWKGKSAAWMLEACPPARLICVDRWAPMETYGHLPNKQHLARAPHVYETCVKNLWPFRDRCLLLRQDTRAGMTTVARHQLVPDVIYVDAAHWYTEVRQDLVSALALAPRAILIGDDWRHPGVRKAVAEIVTPTGRVVNARDNVWESWPT